MAGRETKLLLCGVVLGIPIGVMLSGYFIELFRLAVGIAGYVIFIGLALVAASIVPFGQDILEAGYRFVERRFGRSKQSALERPEEEDRLPVNPWGTPNPYRMTKNRKPR